MIHVMTQNFYYTPSMAIKAYMSGSHLVSGNWTVYYEDGGFPERGHITSKILKMHH